MQRTEIVAALGPTNTGKTYRALQRMKEHDSGMIGLPLRLLAREVYDRLCIEVGSQDVALITGEERIVPRSARYFVCTVEAMPVDREVDFVAVDEIQLAAHHERGHIFTDRILRARGRLETWFIGAESMAPFLSRLVPTATHQKFPRMSRLRCEGSYTLGSLPRRSAVVAFSIPRVYELATRIRAKRGGAAIVLGALSPRARNAQVEMYQSGEVDYLVATDAIGMGLNLDIDRVAFADTRKFDGREERALELPELAQIAGRAGRHVRDGAFGTLAPRKPLPDTWARAIEEHRFLPERQIYYRSSDLDFSSPRALLESLHLNSKLSGVELIADATDTQTLQMLLKREDILDRVSDEPALRLLFEICQIPDYRKLLIEEHARLTGEIFLELRAEGALGEDFLRARIERLRMHSGDIEAITGRIASVRTWRYVSSRSDWVTNSQFAERTQELEDELSDDLHRALVERFVERRNRRQVAPVAASGSGFQAQLAEWKLRLQPHAEEEELSLVERILAEPNESWELQPRAHLVLFGMKLGALVRGRHPHAPRVLFEFRALTLGSGEAKRLETRLREVAKYFEQRLLGPLAAWDESTRSASLRGIVYQLREGLGAASGAAILPLLSDLNVSELAILDRWGFVRGKRYCFLRGRFRLPTTLLRARFAEAWYAERCPFDETLLAKPAFLELEEHRGFSASLLGWERLGPAWVRLDVVEKLLTIPRATEPVEMQRLICSHCGVKRKVAEKIRAKLGFHRA